MTGDAQRRISSVADVRERRVLHEQLVLVGVVAERVHAVRDRVARRLVAGDREQQEEEVEVHLRQAVAVDLGVEQRRDDVVARHLAAFGRERVGVHEHLDLRVLHLFVGDDVLGVLAADHPVAPLEELVAVLLRHAEHLGDHLERELGRDVDDEVGLALLDHLVEDAVGQLADVRSRARRSGGA